MQRVLPYVTPVIGVLIILVALFTDANRVVFLGLGVVILVMGVTDRRFKERKRPPGR